MTFYEETPIGGTGIHGIECTCLISEPYPCPFHGYDNRPLRGNPSRIKVLEPEFMTTQEIRFGMIRTSYENFRFVEYLRPKPKILRLMGMEKDTEVKQKGSEQPPTKVGLDDQRTEQKKAEDAKDGITDEVMKHQSKDHEVQRT